MDKTIEDLEKEYIEQHGMIFVRFTGQSLTPHVKNIKELIDKHECKTVLDYGCGNALEYLQKRTHEKVWGVSATLYDPNHPEYNELPDGEFDGVICTDVMEHIPEPCVESVIERIFSRATKFVYFNIAVRKAVKTLPNGENAHITVMPVEWWDRVITRLNTKNLDVVVHYDK